MADSIMKYSEPTEQVSAAQRFFLSILADHLNDRMTSAPQQIDWQELLSYARCHQVEGIVCQQCKCFLPETVASKLSSIYASTLFFYSNRVALLNKIQTKFDEEGIPFFSVKGLTVAQLYPRPALRTMGDLDVLIHTEDKEKAYQAMLALDFEYVQSGDFVLNFKKNQFEFELHDQLLYQNAVNTQQSIDYCAQAWSHTKPLPGTMRCELDWDFHFIYLLFHLKKHFLNSGVGFRQFMDLAVVAQRCQIDFEALSPTLQQLELLDFATVCLSFCERWFEIKMPLHTDLDEAFYQASTQKIFGNGVFGFDDDSNVKNTSYNEVRRSGRLGTALEKLFPSYQTACTVSYYSFVCNRPYLLPVVWVYRFFRAIRYRLFRRGSELVRRPFEDQGAYRAREDLLKKWGI